MAGDTDIIAAIYDAIIEPSGWDEVVKRIVEATKSVSGGLYIQQADAAHLSATCNVDPFYADAYVQHYYKINPASAALMAIAPGEVRAATHISQTNSFRASAFFNEYVRPQGSADVVAIGLLRAPKAFGNLQLHRSPDAIWVEPAEATPGNPRAASETGGRNPSASLPDESNNRLARRGGRRGRFCRFSFDRGLPGRLRQCQGRGPRAARDGPAV
jgi:hypothetical protein